ncbi:bifunctional riboflavin kinase/FAD synthetase [Pseudooceanicola sp. CBS1P-1]|uniref:Riboflavin biosynthesis protein n=1 Tax=Pseudooceanicola albus TaxID=2692189 RepID=A0A6L7FZF5_9RHOB|nr:MULTISPECIES: bifunctional riboflavin kinase/FAD synthetase [Pseudooceanicola]MBT9382615.1 bifunctional riboflavin kinase/FAD synthetase [Pseudooceanicola endophyticus]MXN17155.1 bifunctional riboflavin kinase/FAD synthetase [Pseudooceanicola albus]
MQIVRDYQFVTESDRGAVAAIGNFDGVHLGHQAVLDIARAEAKRIGAPLGVITFEPHPRQVFAPDGPDFRLSGSAARANRLEKLGVEKLYELAFNPSLSGLSPRDFAEKVLVQGLGIRHVVVGSDFHFGKGRAGDIETLRAFGAELGFGVTAAELVHKGDRKADIEISSTAIRGALREGKPREAAAMLGHWHRIEGKVISGFQRGRELGFPTANMSLDGLLKPKFGVYAVLVDILTGPSKGRYHGAASLGMRPMFDGEEPNLETFIFDFRADIYGCILSIGLVDYLRPELKFDGLPALIEQMDKDCAEARRILDAL